MTSDPARRTSRGVRRIFPSAKSGRRRLLRSLLGAALVIAGVLVPLEPAVLPGPLADAAADSPALAQAGVFVQGTANPCDPGYRDRGSECVRTTKACPANPVVSTPPVELEPSIPTLGQHSEFPTTGRLLPPATYPGFCEARFRESVDSTAYTSCETTKGFIVETYEIDETDASGNLVTDALGNPVADKLCRLIHPATCIDGLNRSGSNECTAIVRRTWRCAHLSGNYIPANEFNLCYEAPSVSYTGTHPACGGGAPAFVAQSAQRCQDYVGQDFAQNPGAVDCATEFDTGTTAPSMAMNTRLGTSAHLWCEFDSAYLDKGCHVAGSACPTTPAWCLKRASKTGGCYAVAHTIKCRGLQAEFDAGTKTPAEVRTAGCQPCVLLPFDPLPMTGCPGDTTADPVPPLGGTNRPQPWLYDNVFKFERDLFFSSPSCARAQRPTAAASVTSGCASQRVCSGAPPGRLAWTSTHHSQLAVVNSRVILRIVDIPHQVLPVTDLYYSGGLHTRAPKETLGFGTDPTGASDAFKDPILRIWPKLDAGIAYTSVGNVTSVGPAGRDPYMESAKASTCITAGAPKFKVTVEELWPDRPAGPGRPDADEDEIKALFGAEALQWWTNFTPQQQREATEARGLVYYPDLATQPQAARDDEDKKRRVEVDCNVPSSVVPSSVGGGYWCPWQPKRSGYFRLSAAGAWILRQYAGRRYWRTNNSVRIYLQLNTAGKVRGDLYSALGSRTARGARLEGLGSISAVTTQVESVLGLRAIGGSLELQPIPRNHDSAVNGFERNEWLYTEYAGPQFRCPSHDFRVSCGSHGWAGNYTVSEPIGIMVHEVRVATRAPNQ